MGGATLGPSPAQLSTAERVFTTRASLLNAYAGTLVRICVNVSVAVPYLLDTYVDNVFMSGSGSNELCRWHVAPSQVAFIIIIMSST